MTSDALAEQRARVEPAQVLAESRDAPTTRIAGSFCALGCLAGAAQLAERRLDRSPAAAACPSKMTAVQSFDRAVRQRRGHRACRRAAAGPRSRRSCRRGARWLVQSTFGGFVAAVLVPADERQRVARAGVGHRARRRSTGPPTGAVTPGTTSNGMPLLVQEQRFLAAAVEHERVAPLQAHDRLALAGLLGEQQADGVLLERLRRRRADVDALGVRPAPAATGAGAPDGRRRRRPPPRGSLRPRTVMSEGSPGPAPTR